MERQHLSLAIGLRIMQRRTALGLTLDELAARSAVSRAMISRIERGEANASAVVLDKLTSGLGITLSTLFAGEGALPSPLLRQADQPAWQDPESLYTRRDVSPPGTGSPVQIVDVAFPAGAEVMLDRYPGSILDQQVWLLEGEMEIALGADLYRLAPGDCLHMRLAQRIAYRNPGPAPARYAVVLTMEPRTMEHRR